MDECGLKILCSFYLQTINTSVKDFTNKSYWRFDLSKGYNNLTLNQSVLFQKGSFIVFQDSKGAKISLSSSQAPDFVIYFNNNSKNVDLIKLYMVNNVSFSIRPLVKRYYYSQSNTILKSYQFEGKYTVNVLFNTSLIPFSQNFSCSFQVYKRNKN